MAGGPSDERGERLVVGLVRGVHGLKGAVRVEVLSDESERFTPGSVLYAEDSGEPLTVTWRREDAPGPGLLVRFRELRSRTAAESLRDRYLEAVPRREALAEGSVYWHEVLEARVRTSAGEELGTVQDVFRAGEGEVFVVRGGARGEVLVPAVRSVITEFSPRQGEIVVDAEALGLEPATPRHETERQSRSAG
ncbi:MAG: ribosome maturation factor RimM [Chloroflexota bacterium]|nr:ribosome maturation factor RimM [Chloroflexota bacterium]